jgi:hypothetical protein
MRGRSHKTTPRVKAGRVQRKNHRDVVHRGHGDLRVQTEPPRIGYRHYLTEEHVLAFIGLLPRWQDLLPAVGIQVFGNLARRVGVRYVGEAAEPTPVRDRPKLLRELRPQRTAGGAGRCLATRPRPARPTDIPRVPLGRIARAAAAATRSRPEAIRTTGPTRRLFVGLAREQGWHRTDFVARACACDPRTIHRVADIDLTPARLCLGDARLLRGIPSWSDSRLDPAAKRGNSAA